MSPFSTDAGFVSKFSVGSNTDSSWTVPATSAHPGGVNVTMVDGHVQFIKNSINRPTWAAIATKGDGEVVGSDSYSAGNLLTHIVVVKQDRPESYPRPVFFSRFVEEANSKRSSTLAMMLDCDDRT